MYAHEAAMIYTNQQVTICGQHVFKIYKSLLNQRPFPIEKERKKTHRFFLRTFILRNRDASSNIETNLSQLTFRCAKLFLFC